MVFAVAIDSDVRVNTNRWHFSGVERELDAAIASTNTVCVKTSTFRIDCHSSRYLASTFAELFDG